MGPPGQLQTTATRARRIIVGEMSNYSCGMMCQLHEDTCSTAACEILRNSLCLALGKFMRTLCCSLQRGTRSH